jgi:redox-sensitive bicupin YhaK (pirin superfamily)
MEERAIHILSGELSVDRTNYSKSRMLILKDGVEIKVKANVDTHLIILGGQPLNEPRFLWWNFVASHKERIEQAKQDWISGKFGKIPGDDKEYIPLPE